MTDQEEISVYLSNLNHLCQRIPETHNNITDDTDSISELIDLLKIPCGEKIVVDFDNEDSQQDLSEIGREDTNCIVEQAATPRKNTFAIVSDDSGKKTTAGLSEIQAAFQKFGVNSVDESEMKQETTTVEIERKPAERPFSVRNETKVPSTESSQSASPVHEAASSQSFSPIHQPVTANVRKWSDADRSDTEAEEHLISQTQTGHISTSCVLEPPEQFRSKPLEDQPAIELAGVHRGSNHDDHTGDRTPVPDTDDDAAKAGYDNSGGEFISLEADLTSESTTDIQRTGFDFLDDW